MPPPTASSSPTIKIARWCIPSMVSSKTGRLAIFTERGQLELYDLETMRKQTSYDFGRRIAFGDFSADGKRLLVLTSDQVVYVLDPAAKEAKAVAAK